MRQTPQARTVFQAGGSTWCKPVALDKESKDVVVGILKYTTRIPLGHDRPLCPLKYQNKKKKLTLQHVSILHNDKHDYN